MSDQVTRIVQESIAWIDASDKLPDDDIQVLVCFERNDCLERDVTIGTYEDGDGDGGLWLVSGALMHFGTVVAWADLPIGPVRS